MLQGHTVDDLYTSYTAWMPVTTNLELVHLLAINHINLFNVIDYIQLIVVIYSHM